MLIPMSHRYYACPYCGQANFGPLMPRTKEGAAPESSDAVGEDEHS